MSRTASPLFTVLLSLGAGAGVFVSVGCAPAMQDCLQAKDCASGQHCFDGACVDGSARDERPSPEPSFDVDTIEGAVVRGGAPPRVFVSEDGSVDVYFLRAGCGELMRARPLLAPLDPVAALQVVAVPPEGTCFVDLDVVRTADGIDHAVVRHDMGAGSGAVTIEIDADGVRGAMMSFAPQSADDARGLIPRVALDADGVAHALWAHGHDDLMDVEQVALPASSESRTSLVTELLNFPSGLSLAFDEASAPAVFSLDFEAPTERLMVSYGTDLVLTRPNIGGTIDAALCAGDIVNAYRDDDDLFLAVIPPDGGSEGKIAVDSVLDTTRINGDLDITCADDTVWIAHQSHDRVRLYADSTLMLELGENDQPNELDAELDGASTVGLAVVAGTAHIAYATTSGALRYATFTP